MSEQWTIKRRRTDWRDQPYWTALWLTLWVATAARVVAETFNHSPGWGPLLHLVGLFCITAVVVEKFAGTVRR